MNPAPWVVACPYCRVKSGEPCRAKYSMTSGPKQALPRSSTHQSRVRKFHGLVTARKEKGILMSIKVEQLQFAWNRLRDLGVGYRAALDGKFHDKFDHSAYIFEMRVDRNVEIGIRCAAGDDQYISIAAADSTPNNDLLAEQLQAVERAIAWIEALPENPCIEMVCTEVRDEDVSPFNLCRPHAQEWQKPSR